MLLFYHKYVRRRKWIAPRLLIVALATAAGPALGAETRRVTDVAPNPGDLRMYRYVPEDLPAGAPLVVALHGCTQSAEDFDDESGWTGLAERHRFAVLLPEQQEANNEDACFNWFLDEDNRRDQGEAASIKAMVEATVAEHDLDPTRVFVTGLSAGGAMAAVLLAAYPEAFAGGAIVAGVPYGCASTTGQPVLALQKQWTSWTNPYGEAAWAAYACGITRAGTLPFQLTPFNRDPEEWAVLIRDADAPSPSGWPKVSLWQGGDDPTVHPLNLRELIDQWTALHGIDAVPDEEEATETYRRRAFADASGEVRVEAFELPDMGHAVPVDPDTGPDPCGKADTHFEDRDVCAALHIARFWGLAGGR